MSCRVQIIGDAAKASAFMPWARKQWVNMESGRKTWHFDGVTIEVIRSGESGIVRIMAEESIGVLLHPRQGDVKLFTHYSWESTPVGIVAVPEKTLHGVAGGWTNGVTPLAGEYIYPLIDADDASYELTSTSADDEELTGSFAGSAGNYGNLYWHNEDDEEPIFLSWKGTPARHFRLANNIEINGFSVQETATPGVDEDMPIFTAFGNKIYQDGAILYTAPRWNWPYTGQDRCFILGAMQDTNGGVWAMMQSDRYNVPKYVTYFSDGHRIASDVEGDKSSYLSSHSGVTVTFEKEYPTKLGIFTMLWKQGGPVDGWTFVQEWNTGRQGLPWFGNKSGTEFVNPLGSRITVAGAKTDLQPVTGTYKEEMTGGESDSMCSHGRFAASYTDKDFYEFNLDEIVYGSRSLTFSAISLKTFIEAKTKVYEGLFDQLYDPDDPAQAPEELHWEITQYTTYTVVNGQGFNLGAAGGQGQHTVSYSGFSVVNGVVVAQNPCTEGQGPYGSVTVTDSCGASITREVRLAAVGYWSTTGSHYYGCSSWAFGGCDWTLCGTNYTMDTACKTYYATGGSSYGYPSTSSEGLTKCTAYWGCISSVVTSYYISSYNYYGTGGCVPPSTGVSCGSTGLTLVPISAQRSVWVCP